MFSYQRLIKNVNIFNDLCQIRRADSDPIGAATSAIGHRDSGFKDYYERMLSHGITPANAKHSVARKMVSTMSAMWKTDSKFDEKLL